jgi:DNA-binding transcriptional MerR regulator
MHDYDASDIKRLFGLTPATLRALIRAGHIEPQRLKVGYRYSFQDLLLLRTVSALRAARVPARKIHAALLALRAGLPGDLPMTSLTLAASGERVAVREAGRLREAGSNQYALPLPAPAGAPRVADAQRERLEEAQRHYEHALDLEDADASAAMRAYQACLALDAGHIEARINLGRLLHLAGALTEAERTYRAAAGGNALLAYNLAVLLEDLARDRDAVEFYRQALVLDPSLPDAHFNLARLYERDGDTQASFRHLLAYRRLTSAAR